MRSVVDRARAALLEHLAHLHDAWAPDELVLVGEGLECLVFRGDSPALGDVAIKVPRCAVFENDNDASVSAGALLRQEAEYARHLCEHDLAAPAVLALEVDTAYGDELPGYLVQRYVEHDGSEPEPGELGRLIAAIHRLPLPPSVPLAQGAESIERVIAERLTRRADVVERIVGTPVPLPDQALLEAALRAAARPRRLLHMDARAANLLTRGGVIHAIVDWSNALVGDPYLELARIAEYGLDSAEFRAAYEGPVPAASADLGGEGRLLHNPPVAPPSPVVELIYRLDTAVMLAVVFFSEAPDPVRGARQMERVQTLSRELEQHWPGETRAMGREP
ncbi:phosphotransferase family protein [Haliangium sp.]|uniref:phosphotransferase family protein n=1 Tax=Haliangium sp. TaxID=2663208 RepID=UPI003D139C0C